MVWEQVGRKTKKDKKHGDVKAVYSLYSAFSRSQVLLDALKRWETREEPGHIWEIEYLEYDSSSRQPIGLYEG